MTVTTTAAGWLIRPTSRPGGNIVLATCPDPDCLTLLRADGICRTCERLRELPAAMKAIHGIVWDPATTKEQLDEAAPISAAYDGIKSAVYRDSREAPNSCAVCAVVEPEHGQRYGIGGWHTWTAPTNAQRLDRMRARRAARDDRLWREVNRRFEALYGNQ